MAQTKKRTGTKKRADWRSTRGKTNWRGEPARKCYMCGSTNTKAKDKETRTCRTCSNDYAIGPGKNWELRR